MDNNLKELTNVLGREQKLFAHYLELLVEQQEFLMDTNLEGVKATVEKINALSENAVNLENDRRRILEKISITYKLRPEEVNVTSLLEKLGGPIFREFVRLKEILTDIQEKITQRKITNELLIDQSMRMISHSIQPNHKTTNLRATSDNPAEDKGAAGAFNSLISKMV